MNVCRICVCKKPRKDLTELRITDHEKNIFYLEIMMFCLDIQVTEDSKISTKVCVKCFRKIIEFYNFKKLAQKNEVYLRSFTSDYNLIKDEVVVAACLDEEEIFVPETITGEECINVKTEDITIESNIDEDNGLSEDVFVPNDVKEEKIKIEDIAARDDENVNQRNNFVNNIKEKDESESDDEYLSNIKKVKHNSENVDKTKFKGSAKKSKNTKGLPKKVKQKYQAPKIQVCEECGKAVKNLKTHAVRHMAPEQFSKLKCDYCDRVFKHKASKRKHIKTRHLNPNRKCPICSKEVIYLNQHITTVHCPDKKLYECISCNRRYTSQSQLNSHMKSHTTELQYECDICNKKFRRKIILSYHKRFVHEKERPHVCEYCSKGFSSNIRLQEHLRTHRKEKPYKCDKCDKCFSTRNIRNGHMMTHSTDKKFACKLCDKAFVQLNYLRAHMLSHTKEKKFSCQFCGVKFHRSDHRKRHEFTAHLKHTTGNKL